MTFAPILAPYVPPASVHLAEVKAEYLAFVIRDIAHACRADNARDAENLLSRAERRLADALEAVKAARAEALGECRAGLEPQTAPRPAPVKSAGAMGVAVGGLPAPSIPAPEAQKRDAA